MQLGNSLSTASIQAVLKLYHVSHVTLVQGTTDVLYESAYTDTRSQTTTFLDYATFTVQQVNLDAIESYTLSCERYTGSDLNYEIRVLKNGGIVGTAQVTAATGWTAISWNVTGSIAPGDVFLFQCRTTSSSFVVGMRNPKITGVLTIKPDSPLVAV